MKREAVWVEGGQGWVGAGDTNRGRPAGEEVGADCAGLGIFWQSLDPMVPRGPRHPRFQGHFS